MDLCALDQVKMLAGIKADNTNEDDTLRAFIRATSLQAERYMNRKMETKSRTEYRDVTAGQSLFSLDAYPITTITSVHNDPNWGFASSTSVSTTYITYEADTGLLYIDKNVLVPGFQVLKVVYTGGLTTKTSYLYNEYRDLCFAIARQVVYLHKMKGKFGMDSSASNQGSVTFQVGQQFIPEVRGVLDMYRRPTW